MWGSVVIFRSRMGSASKKRGGDTNLGWSTLDTKTCHWVASRNVLLSVSRESQNWISFTVQQTLWARASSLSKLHGHTQTHHTRLDSSGRVISPSQRTLPDNAQQRDIHTPRAIRTRNPGKRAVTHPSVRRRGHWDRPDVKLTWNWCEIERVNKRGE